jgi:hypothetical protein
MYSPWGAVQTKEVFDRGFMSVSTASHGGFMLSECFARKRLSEAALKRGDSYNNYICYEEDCDWAIPAWEMRDYWSKIFSYQIGKDSNYNPEQILLETLSLWNADYLLEIGVTPKEEQYKYYRKMTIEDQMRKQKSNDVIICARGTWYTKIPGVIEVITADDKEHLITEESYHKLQEENELLLLSRCKLAS